MTRCWRVSVHTCPRQNTFYSYLVILVVGGIPSWFAWRSAVEVHWHNRAAREGVRWRQLVGTIPPRLTLLHALPLFSLYLGGIALLTNTSTSRLRADGIGVERVELSRAVSARLRLNVKLAVLLAVMLLTAMVLTAVALFQMQ